MATRRKTSEDYRREYDALSRAELSLENHVRERLNELVKIHSEAIVIKNYLGSDDNINAKSLIHTFLDGCGTGVMINYIKSIEKWSAEQQPVIQKEIDW